VASLCVLPVPAALSLAHPITPLPKMRRVLALEGNIGAGKSTLLRLLKQRGLKSVEEPVAKWQSVGDGDGTNLLDKFYRDPKRWAFTFQTYAFLSRTQAAVRELRDGDRAFLAAGGVEEKSEAPPSYVFERSLYSDKHCFASNCYKTGLFDDVEWRVYSDYHAWVMDEHPCLLVDGFVYLRTSPATCLARSQRRGRPEEGALPLAYLQQLHARHEEWLRPGACSGPDQPAGEGGIGGPGGGGGGGAGGVGGVVNASGVGVGGVGDLEVGLSSDGVPVLVVDCDVEFEGDPARLAKVGEAIDKFLLEAVKPRDIRA